MNILVKLDRPLLVESEYGYETVYGFVDINNEDERLVAETSWCYVGYLAAIHELESGLEDDFSIDYESGKLADKDGVIHNKIDDDWSKNIYRRCMSKLRLTYTLHNVDISSLDGEGVSGDRITDPRLIDALIETGCRTTSIDTRSDSYDK